MFLILKIPLGKNPCVETLKLSESPRERGWSMKQSVTTRLAHRRNSSHAIPVSLVKIFRDDFFGFIEERRGGIRTDHCRGGCFAHGGFSLTIRIWRLAIQPVIDLSMCTSVEINLLGISSGSTRHNLNFWVSFSNNSNWLVKIAFVWFYSFLKVFQETRKKFTSSFILIKCINSLILILCQEWSIKWFNFREI